jgi:nucleoid-associated protein YgaU
MAKSPPAGAVTQDVREPFDDVLPTGLPAAPSTSEVSSTLRTHVVTSGDTLEKLSREYYGMPDRWHVIYEANIVELSSGRPLRPGMELVIPDPP